jgi:hypothetical protein
VELHFPVCIGFLQVTEVEVSEAVREYAYG